MAKKRENISENTSMALKPRIFSLANLFPSMVGILVYPCTILCLNMNTVTQLISAYTPTIGIGLCLCESMHGCVALSVTMHRVSEQGSNKFHLTHYFFCWIPRR